MSIRFSRVMELVSQAEKEGVTLAAMVSREMSVEEMELAQDELASRLRENYTKIEDFMAEISIPSIYEMLNRRGYLPPQAVRGSVDIVSDGEEIEQNSS